MGAFYSKSMQDYRDFNNSSGDDKSTPAKFAATRVSAYIADDPRSPCNLECSFERTPLQLKVEQKAFNRASTDSFFSVDAQPTTPPVPSRPQQSTHDPRSPCVGIERTPLSLEGESTSTNGTSMQVTGNFSNLQLIWDESRLSLGKLSDEIPEPQLASTPKSSPPLVRIEEPSPQFSIISDAVTPRQRTPLAKVQVQSPLTAELRTKKAEPVDEIRKRKRDPTPKKVKISAQTKEKSNYQKAAQLNRMRRESQPVSFQDKEN